MTGPAQRAKLYLASAVRSIRRGASRSALAALSIAVATCFATSASWMYYMADMALGADAQASLGADAVWSTNSRPISLTALESALNRSEVEAWSPALLGRAIVRAPQATSIVVLKGVLPERYPFYGRDRWYGESGTLDAGSITLTRNLADRLGVAVGDTVELANGALNQTYRVTHIVTQFHEYYTDANVYGVGYLDIDQARRLLQVNADTVNEVALKASGQPDFAGRLASLEAAVPLSKTYSAVENLRSMRVQVSRLMLYVQTFGIVAVLIAAIGITNTVTILVQDRVKEIATLKAIGLRPRQVTAMFIVEGTLIGLLGVALGLVAATLVAASARAYMGIYLQLTFAFRFFTEPLLVGSVVGLGSSVGAAWLPALQAARISPALAWQESLMASLPQGVRNTLWELLGLLISVGAAAGLYLHPLLQELSPGITIPVSVLIGVGLALFVALLLASMRLLVARGLTLVGGLKRRFRSSGYLALHTLQGQAKRFALTCVCLILSAVTSGMSGMLGSALQDGLERQLSTQSGGNLFVSTPAALEAEVTEVIAKVVADPRSIVRTVNVDAQLLSVKGRPAAEAQKAAAARGLSYMAGTTFNLQGVDLDGNLPTYQLAAGRDLVPADRGQPVLLMLDEMAQAWGIQVGDTVALAFGDKQEVFAVIGLIRSERVKTTLLRTTVESLGAAPIRSLSFAIQLVPSQLAPALQTLNRTLPRSAMALSLADNLMAVTRTLDFQTAVLRFMSLLAVAAAVLLIVNEVVTGVVRQQRELATMKVLGITPRSLLQGLFLQYAILGLFSGIIGAVLALALTAMVASQILQSGIRIPIWILAIPVLTSLLSALIAVLSASRGIARRPVDALRT